MARMLIALALPMAGWAAQGAAPTPMEALAAAARTHDEQALAQLSEKLIAAADSATESYDAQRAAAECLLVQATRLQNDRKIRKLPGKEDKAKRAQQVSLGNQGIPYAESALNLAESGAEKAQAHRVLGELYSHLITGPITGFKYGSTSLSHIQEALKLLPDDPECNRAIGMMYLHNPPMKGGDAEKAIATYKRCAELDEENDLYPLLLAMAHRKKKQFDEARRAAAWALKLNPANLDAKHLLTALYE